MSLTAWNTGTDFFSHTELAANWTAIDVHDHTSGKGVQIPAGGLANNAVTTGSIAAAAVTSAKLANDSVGGAQIVTNSVGPAEIAALPSCRAYTSTGQSVPTTTITNILCDTERFDGPAGYTFHSTSSNTDRFTATQPGIHLVIVNTSWPANATGTVRRSYISLNGSGSIAVQGSAPAGASGVFQTVSTLYHLSSGDYVVGQFQHDATTSLSPTAEVSIAWLSAQ